MEKQITDVEYHMKDILLKDRKQKVKKLSKMKNKGVYNFATKKSDGSWENLILSNEDGSLILNTLIKVFEEQAGRLEEELNEFNGDNVIRTVV